jgi:hypothetical protein
MDGTVEVGTSCGNQIFYTPAARMAVVLSMWQGTVPGATQPEWNDQFDSSNRCMAAA